MQLALIFVQQTGRANSMSLTIQRPTTGFPIPVDLTVLRLTYFCVWQFVDCMLLEEPRRIKIYEHSKLVCSCKWQSLAVPENQTSSV